MNNVYKYSSPVGQATVEVIFIMNIFIVVIFILANIFLIAYNQLVVIESANEGARCALLVWNDAQYNMDKIKLCISCAGDVLQQKLRNAIYQKPEVSYSNGKVKVKASCKYKISIPVIDRLIDTEIYLQHTSTYRVLEKSLNV